MAGAARVGSLHVALGLDSADFTSGMNKAGNGLDKFTRAAKIGFAAVAVAAAAAGTALAVAVKGSIDRADNLSKMAQRVGMTTEALSRLEWAAKLSDVSLEQLSTGMKKLSQNMLEVSQGRGAQAATAFQALGISVKDAAGNLRSSDDVLADVADRFSRMPDGAEKTALAMNLLGRAGADMIPLLNSGKDGLKDMADESDRLGNTLTTKTGKAAEAFNDSITRLQAGLQGMVNKIAEAALPTLNNLIETLTSPDFLAAMQDFAIAVISIADAVAQVFVGASKAFQDFMGMVSSAANRGPLSQQAGGLSDGELQAQIDEANDIIKSPTTNSFAKERSGAWLKALQADQQGRLTTDPIGAGASFGQLQETLGATDGAITQTSTVADQLREIFETLGTGAGGAGAGVDNLKAAMTDGMAVFTATRTPVEAYGIEVERLNGLLAKGAIDQDTYNRAVLQAQDSFQTASMAGNEFATTLSDGLPGVFSAVISGSDNAIGAVESLVQALAKLAIQKGFEMLLGAAFGGGNFMGGSFGAPALKLGFQTGVPSFDGGGITGSGPRVGGLDGKGGFMAMMHPNELVLDQTRGQTSGGGLVVNIDARGAQVGVAEQIDQWARFQLPGLVNNINSDPLARG